MFGILNDYNKYYYFLVNVLFCYSSFIDELINSYFFVYNVKYESRCLLMRCYDFKIF